jgi:hypothetical protein
MKEEGLSNMRKALANLLPSQAAVQEMARMLRGGPLADAQELMGVPHMKKFTTTAAVDKKKPITFPNLLLETLSHKTLALPLKRPFVVLLSFTKFGHEQTQSWKKHLLSRDCAFPTIELSIAEGFGTKYARNAILLPSLQSTYPTSRWDYTCLVTGLFWNERLALGITNRVICYVFVVRGEKGDVAFMGCGEFDPAVDHLLVNGAKKLDALEKQQ